MLTSTEKISVLLRFNEEEQHINKSQTKQPLSTEMQTEKGELIEKMDQVIPESTSIAGNLN
jgi:hypothetical protein